MVEWCFDMTRVFRLEYSGGKYCSKVSYESRGEMYERMNPILCGEFVELVLHGYYGHGQPCEGKNAYIMPSAIEVKISDMPLEDSMRIAVVKGGYYRWHWRHLEEYYKFFSTWYGMYFGVERILDDLFSDARCDGLDGEKELWIEISEV